MHARRRVTCGTGTPFHSPYHTIMTRMCLIVVVLILILIPSCFFFFFTTTGILLRWRFGHLRGTGPDRRGPARMVALRATAAKWRYKTKQNKTKNHETSHLQQQQEESCGTTSWLFDFHLLILSFFLSSFLFKKKKKVSTAVPRSWPTCATPGGSYQRW